MSTNNTPIEIVRYGYRLRPGAIAIAALEAEWDRCRWVWNQCVGRDRDLRSEGVTPNQGELQRELTDWRGRYDWLAAGSVVPQQQAIRDWHAARRDSFKVRGRNAPTFHSSKHRCVSLNYTTRGFNIRDGRLVLAGDISIPVVWSRALPSGPTSVRVRRDRMGRWWASFVVRRPVESWSKATEALGIDWGVKAVATTTDPEFDLPHAGRSAKIEPAIRKIHRQMARRQCAAGVAPSRGYLAARRRAANLQQHASWGRADDARKWARRVVAEHDRIAIEDLRPGFMFRSTLAKRAADASIARAKDELLTYAERAGRTGALVPVAYTTMTCSDCGARAKQRLELRERTFRCAFCGFSLDRDRNAARVILAVAGFDDACVDRVRPVALPGARQREHGTGVRPGNQTVDVAESSWPPGD